MAYRLKNRNMQIPNGLRYVHRGTGEVIPTGSFSIMVNAIIAHRRAHPELVQKGYSLDPLVVADELDAYNTRICLDHGWTKYVIGGGATAPIPKPKPPSQSEQKQLAAVAGRVQKIWSGIRTLNDWIDSEDPPVSQELADIRASVCARCPQNGEGDFTKWFTKPASDAIRKQIERLRERQLSTPYDDKINICEVCLCPLKLKVHTPLAHIEKHLADSVWDDLRAVSGCWIVQEIGKS